METLLTAIAIIKQSRVYGDERCQALVTSLKDCLVSIQNNFGYRCVYVPIRTLMLFIQILIMELLRSLSHVILIYLQEKQPFQGERERQRARS